MKILDAVYLRKLLIKNAQEGTLFIKINNIIDSDRIESGRVVPVFDTIEEYAAFNPSLDDKVNEEVRRRELAGDPGFLQDRISRESYEESLAEYLRKSMQKEFDEKVNIERRKLIESADVVEEKDVDKLYFVRVNRPYTLTYETDACTDIFSTNRLAVEYEKERNKYISIDDKHRYYVQTGAELLSGKGQLGE